MKQLIISLVLVTFGFISLSAQPQDNSLQKFMSQIQTVLAKDVESFSQSDLDLLQNTIKLNPSFYGAANQKIVQKIIKDAKTKKMDYDNYLKTKTDLSKTRQDLDVTTDAWRQSEKRGDSLYSENVQLKVLIDELTNRINKLDKESKRLQTINKRIQQENMQTKDLLETSRTSIRRIMNLMPLPQKNELNEQIPASLQDSLNQSECQVAELLKNNFVYTIDGFKHDQTFLDSASNYFRDNKVHLPIVEEFISTGSELAARLKQSGTDCANNYAAEIEVAMSDFKTMIESKESSFGDKVARFFSENSVLIIILVVLIALIIALLIFRKKKNIRL